jgi:hypothetical protein
MSPCLSLGLRDTRRTGPVLEAREAPVGRRKAALVSEMQLANRGESFSGQNARGRLPVAPKKLMPDVGSRDRQEFLDHLYDNDSFSLGAHAAGTSSRSGKRRPT